MANTLNWQLGHEGKGNVYDDDSISTWSINRDNEPHHYQKGQEDAKTPRFHFYLSPEGGLWDGGTTFNNQTPHSDDQVVADVVAQHPGVYDARHELSMDWDAPEERVEMPGGGYGHAYNLLEAMSKVAAGDSWADFHTELKIPRGVRKQIRRWVDRMKWPEGSTKMDAREYHITVLDMDEYDEEFAKWARDQLRDKTFHFKSTKMDIFGETVVVRLECPEWDEIALEWGEKAESQGLEPHRFPGGPKAHISVGKSPGRKWPQGIPNPHVKFDTRMFNVKKNSMALNPNDMNEWIKSHGPYMEHWTRKDNVPQIMQEGLRPPNLEMNDDYEHVGETPSWEGYLETRPNHVYLGRPGYVKPGSASAYEVPLRIDLRKLDPQKLKADEDHARTYWPMWQDADDPSTSDWYDENQPPSPDWYDGPESYSLGNWADEQGLDDPQWTADSLYSGSLAHEGSIPPQAISLHPDYMDRYSRQGSDTAPADDLKAWLDSFTPEQAQPPSLHHTDGDDFTPQIVAPVVQMPHIDPPSKPYAPYNWAEEGWEESPLDRVSTGPQPLPMDDQLYYRAHHADAPFGIEYAQSAPIEGADIPEQYMTPKEGYSAFWNPHHLQQYMDEMGWDTNQRNVVAFRGKAVGSGVDGEPLIMPHTNQPETTRPYQDFLHRLDYTPNGYGQWHEHTWGDGPNGQQVDDGYRTLGEIFESAIDTHICPKCGEDSNSPICATCGYDPQNSPDDYQQMKNDWYDRAWSVPGNQPRPVPNQPMHWRDDHAKNVSLAHHKGGWHGF